MHIPKFLKPFAVTATVAVVMLMLAATTVQAAEPIKIGALAPESHILGQTIFNAAELAVEEINAAGGIDGRQVKLYKYNTHFSAADASRAFQRAVQQDGVDAMVGIFTSEVALAMMPWASRLKTPLIITGAASTEIPKRIAAQPDRFKYVFHGYVNSQVLAKQVCIVQAQLFMDNDRLDQYHRAVIFSEDAAWTVPINKAYKKCLPKVGVKIVDTITFSPETTDFTPIYSRIENSGANIIMAAIAHVGVKPVVQWRQQRVPALFAGVNGQGGSSKFWAATNGATEGVIVGTPGVNGAAMTDKTPAFYKAFTKQFGVEEPAYDAYTTYDAVYALKHAIEKAGSTDADKLVQALEKVQFTGVLGQIDFYSIDGKYPHEVKFNADPTKGQSFLTFQWQDGKQVIVWPDRLATGKVKIPPFVPQPKSE